MKREKNHNRILKIVKNSIVTIIMLSSFVICYFALVARKQSGVPAIGSYIPVSIQSDSMKDVFKKGDLIISKKYDGKSKLVIKDIITFYTLIDNKRVLNTHMIEKIWFDSDKRMKIQTKGTNNDAVDEYIVKQSDIVGIYTCRIPYVGLIIQFMQTRFGFFVCILFPLVVAFLIQLLYTIIQYALLRKDENVQRVKNNYTEEIMRLKQQVNVLEKQLDQSRDENNKLN